MQARGQAPRPAFERVYSFVVALKGLYGLIELAAGLVLLVAPGSTAVALTAVASELAEGGSPFRAALARSVGSAGVGLTDAVPLALFFLIHGVVKLLTVYALLRRKLRWYPIAIVALGVLLAVQVVDLLVGPTIGASVLTVLDVVVIVFVAWEYRRLRRRNRIEAAGDGAPSSPAQRERAA